MPKVVPEKDIVCIPGISSLQYFFAKLYVSWEDARLMSLRPDIKDLAAALKIKSWASLPTKIIIPRLLPESCKQPVVKTV